LPRKAATPSVAAARDKAIRVPAMAMRRDSVLALGPVDIRGNWDSPSGRKLIQG